MSGCATGSREGDGKSWLSLDMIWSVCYHTHVFTMGLHLITWFENVLPSQIKNDRLKWEGNVIPIILDTIKSLISRYPRSNDGANRQTWFCRTNLWHAPQKVGSPWKDLSRIGEFSSCQEFCARFSPVGMVHYTEWGRGILGVMREVNVELNGCIT